MSGFGSAPVRANQRIESDQPVVPPHEDVTLGDPLMDDVLKRLFEDDPDEYIELVNDLRGGNATDEAAAQVKLTALVNDHDTELDVQNSLGETVYLPQSIKARSDMIFSYVQNEQLDPRAFDNYHTQMVNAAQIHYTSANRGSDTLIESIQRSRELLSAEFTVLFLRLAPWALRGEEIIESWEDMFLEYARILDDLRTMPNEYMELRVAAGAVKNVLQFKAYQTGDLALAIYGEKTTHDTLRDLHRMEFFRSFHDLHPYPGYDPTVVSVAVGMINVLYEGEKDMSDVQAVLPSSFHSEVRTEVQDASGNYDPMIPLIEWFNSNPNAFEEIRVAMDRIVRPVKVSDLLRMRERDFVAALGPGIPQLTDFPDTHLVLDPFYLNDITFGTERITPYKREDYPEKIAAGLDISVYRYSDGSDQYDSLVAYTPNELIALLLYQIIKHAWAQEQPEDAVQRLEESEKKKTIGTATEETHGDSSYAVGDTVIWMGTQVSISRVKYDEDSASFKYQASSLHDDVSVNERYWIAEEDLSKPTFGDIPDDLQDDLVLDPMGPEIQTLFYYAMLKKGSQTAAEQFTGVSRQMIGQITKQAAAQTGIREAFSASELNIAGLNREFAEQTGLVDRGMGQFIKGLDGFEGINGGVAAAIDSWFMDQQWKIQQLWNAYGQPYDLIDGTPLSEKIKDGTDPHEFDRLPVVYTTGEDGDEFGYQDDWAAAGGYEVPDWLGGN